MANASPLFHDQAIAPGSRVRLACRELDCFVGEIDVTSKGGVPRGAPTCPGCRKHMTPQGDMILPSKWDDIE